MKKLLIAAVMLASAGSAMAQVSINLGQNGYYGRIDLGDFRSPPVYYAQPIIIERGERYSPEPMYLRVPPGHMKKWGKHCSKYNACGRQVYFVKDEWYSNTYAPRYRETGGWRNDGNRDRKVEYKQDKFEFKSGSDKIEHRGGGNDKHDKHDKHEKHDKGGHGNGKGNGKGKD